MTRVAAVVPVGLWDALPAFQARHSERQIHRLHLLSEARTFEDQRMPFGNGTERSPDAPHGDVLEYAMVTMLLSIDHRQNHSA